MNAWLIEYEGAKPFPVYVQDVWNHSCVATADVWVARRFETKTEAEKWMADPVVDEIHCLPFSSPWHVVEHSFEIRCNCCGQDPGFVPAGEWGFCDGCIPF